MTSNIYKSILLLLAFLPFVLFIFFDVKANLKKQIRNRQFFMPIIALIYCIVIGLFITRLGNYCVYLFESIVNGLNNIADKLANTPVLSLLKEPIKYVANAINKFLTQINFVYVVMILFNTMAMLLYVIVKRVVLLFFKTKKRDTSLTNKIVSVFYDQDEKTGLWYIKRHFGQAKTFLKTAFYATTVISMLAVLVSFYLCLSGLIKVPFYPVFAIILIGELAFFIDGLEYSELENEFSADIDNSRHVTNYVILRKKLKELFGDKLTSEGTTLNDSIVRGGSIEQILGEIENEYGRQGANYNMFIRRKAKDGLKPNADYVRSGIDLAMGKSLLFNTPFYYKLSPYVFYAMHLALLKGKKVLIVLGRHGTTDDVREWCDRGLFEVTNLPGLWSISELGKTESNCDIGIVTRSGVHDLELHRANSDFLNEVSFVVLVEPSRLVTTAQIGLNLLVKNISVSNNAVFCSVDKNCDGLVDSLSHILMTSITEVSATEFPQGTSSYMCWNADNDHLQHRITPGISRYLGMGTEFSFTALKNHVERTIWYGGDAFPILDAHWIAKQYYHKLLESTPLPATQETFDKYFKVSYNICNEEVRENSFITVEDEFNNLFEIKREFSTMSRNQGFVNVISTDYMMRGYMTENEEIFNSDPKAIPYISADYARTRRNSILKICLKMSIYGMYKEELVKELLLMGSDVDEKNLCKVVWKEICNVFCTDGSDEIIVDTQNTHKVFGIDVIEYRRDFSSKTGRYEDLYTISDISFKHYVIDDLQNARYIAERGNESTFIGTELKGHILQKYLPGQFITLSGKYYEMISVTPDNQVIMRRASDHINGRYSYRQTRKYRIDSARDNAEMGMLKTINGICIYNQFADFVVDTPSYWRMKIHNDFENGSKVQVNNIPQRTYFNKHILKLDFSQYGEQFTAEVRAALTLMMNEVFRTLFAENHPYIAAVTAGDFEGPLTYSLSGDAVSEDSIYIIEDSQLDLGLLVAVERNFERIMNIVSDYLAWNKSMLEEKVEIHVPVKHYVAPSEDSEEGEKAKSSKNRFGFLKKIGGFFKNLFAKLFKKKKQKKAEDVESTPEADSETAEEADEPTVDIDDKTDGEDFAPVQQDENTESPKEVSNSSDAEGKQKKKGFFASLFGKKDKKKKRKKTEHELKEEESVTEEVEGTELEKSEDKPAEIEEMNAEEKEEESYA